MGEGRRLVGRLTRHGTSGGESYHSFDRSGCPWPRLSRSRLHVRSEAMEMQRLPAQEKTSNILDCERMWKEKKGKHFITEEAWSTTAHSLVNTASNGSLDFLEGAGGMFVHRSRRGAGQQAQLNLQRLLCRDALVALVIGLEQAPFLLARLLFLKQTPTSRGGTAW